MNYIKLFENYSDEDLIHKLCAKFMITNYTINADYSIDVSGDVYIDPLGHRLPIRFRKVEGYFFCVGSKLTTLKGCPEYVGGDFYCSNNKLTSMEFGPKIIEGCADYSKNKINSLKFAPKSVGGWIKVNDNDLPLILLEFEKDSDKIKTLIEYQEEYGIWNDNGSFNTGRYDIFIKDIFRK